MGDICWQRLCRSLPDEEPAERPRQKIASVKSLTVKIKVRRLFTANPFKIHRERHHLAEQLQQMARGCLEPMLERQPRIRLLGVGVSNWLETEEPDASKLRVKCSNYAEFFIRNESQKRR